MDVLLARGVPALSAPMGSRTVIGQNFAENKNLNNDVGTSWPRSGVQSFNGWRHSDIKSIALPFVSLNFLGILTEMDGSP